MQVWKTFGAILFGGILLGASITAANEISRPNIVFIFIDDIGWGDLSCYGSPVTNKQGQVITPHLDQLAAEGMRFTQGYVASPICSPSRTGVLTGIHPARYAIHSFLNDKTSNATRNMVDWLQPDTVTAPRLFQQAGYLTGQFGKWHMGNGRDVNDAPPPQAYGFDQSLVAFEGNGDRLLYWNDNGGKYGLSQQNEDATVGTFEYVYWYQAAPRHTDAALAFITNAVAAGRPFYVHVPYNDTHSPYNVPPGQENDFDHITSDPTGKLFLGELHNLDKQIGRLVQGIDALGVGQDTLILAIGDNGAPNDALNTLLRRNGGLRTGKGNLYEGGIREPFIIRWPGTVPAGVVNSNTIITTLDLLPTWCALAGIPLPNAPFAGEDMSDVFRGTLRARTRPVFWEYGTVSGLSPASPKLAVRDGQYKMMRNPDGTRREFYLLPGDHAEANNQINNPVYASVITNLESQLMAWYDEIILGNVGERVPCGPTNAPGLVLADSFEVTGGNSPSSGFALNAGVNYQLADRLTGAAAPVVQRYRLGSTGGTSPRQAADFSIVNNRLTVAPRNGNGRFELSSDGITPLNLGGYLAGRTYELTVQMNISVVGRNYAQRMSLGLSDTSDVPVGGADLCLQIGTDGSGGLGVFKRVNAASHAGGGDLNVRLTQGLAIGTPITLRARIVDYNDNVTDYSSAYEIWANGVLLDTGSFRFNASTTARYLVFDVAAHEGPVDYDNLQLTVTDDHGQPSFCRRPILKLSQYHPASGEAGGPRLRLYWTAQPGLVAHPLWSGNLVDWAPVTNALGAPLNLTTRYGTIQWLEIEAPPAFTAGGYFRLQ
ncbi:MAG TPA: sulfatase-like hydrolase/transferase [Verrucomicrobiota bacterium]|nr:sulfatase-like hydrolase/transferase [Verrucomicrobiota bacterium]HQB15089.1 sulfatase-like hydrolase/transferase [Verrucomicrobiota bacterium]